MEPYKNLGVEYESGPDLIRVKFSDGSVYLYTDASAGAHNINQMNQLASNGQRLNSFININVRKAYAGKAR